MFIRHLIATQHVLRKSVKAEDGSWIVWIGQNKNAAVAAFNPSCSFFSDKAGNALANAREISNAMRGVDRRNRRCDMKDIT
jgi:hypothetical protein